MVAVATAMEDWYENVISSQGEKSKAPLSKDRLSFRQERILADATTAVARVWPGRLRAECLRPLDFARGDSGLVVSSFAMVVATTTSGSEPFDSLRTGSVEGCRAHGILRTRCLRLFVAPLLRIA